MAEEQASRLVELSEMPPSALIAIDDLAKQLNRDHESIRKAIKRGELPQPFRLCSKRYWLAGQLLDFFHRRAEHIKNQPLTDDQPSDLRTNVPHRPTKAKPYKSPLREVK